MKIKLVMVLLGLLVTKASMSGVVNLVDETSKTVVDNFISHQYEVTSSQRNSDTYFVHLIGSNTTAAFKVESLSNAKIIVDHLKQGGELHCVHSFINRGRFQSCNSIKIKY